MCFFLNFEHEPFRHKNWRQKGKKLEICENFKGFNRRCGQYWRGVAFQFDDK